MVRSGGTIKLGVMELLARIRDAVEKLMGYGWLDVVAQELVFDWIHDGGQYSKSPITE